MAVAGARSAIGAHYLVKYVFELLSSYTMCIALLRVAA